MRVVVTGLGMASPLGIGVKNSWSRLVKGETGIKSINGLFNFQHQSLPSLVAGLIDRTELEQAIIKEDRQAKNLPKYIQYALLAASEAIQDSGINLESLGDTAGTCIGSGMAPLDVIEDALITVKEKGHRKLSPYFIPRILPNMAAGHVSIRHNIQGPLFSPSTACATGAHAIGDAFRFIKHGYAKVMIAGATDSGITLLSIAGFSQAKALSTTHNDAPEEASRPFDDKRDGFVIGEGSGVIVLEELDSAIARNAKIYAEILGYGCSADAYHITASHPEGLGAERAMMAALKDANLNEAEIDFVNAHATSTVLGDLAEAKAISRIFSKRSEKVLVTSNKGAIGHSLGAAGAVESIFTILSLQNNIIPPILNYQSGPDPSIANINLVHGEAKRLSTAIRFSMKNSFGFGGTNASLCFGKY